MAGWLDQRASTALTVGSAYLFGGLLFSGDLDVRSRPYKRWLWLRWVWIPYRHTFKHRSFWTHGPLIGTVIRMCYLGGWILVLLGLTAWVGATQHWWTWQPQHWLRLFTVWVHQHAESLLLVGLGLELGSASHSLSDWIASAWKRFHRRRLSSNEPIPPYRSSRRSPSKHSSSSVSWILAGLGLQALNPVLKFWLMHTWQRRLRQWRQRWEPSPPSLPHQSPKKR